MLRHPLASLATRACLKRSESSFLSISLLQFVTRFEKRGPGTPSAAMLATADAPFPFAIPFTSYAELREMSQHPCLATTVKPTLSSLIASQKTQHDQQQSPTQLFERQILPHEAEAA